MELNVAFYALAVPAILIAGFAKGGFGGGAVFLATPLLAMVIPPQLAVSLMLPLLVFMDIGAIRAFWGKWDWPNARLLMTGSIAGVVVGTLIFGIADPDHLRLLIGGLAVSFVLFQLARSRGLITIKPQPLRPGRAMFWGSLAGFTSFISHAGSPPALVHLLGQRLEKTTFQATTVVVFFWINLIKLPPYFALGLFTKETLIANLTLLPAALIGVQIGVWAHDRISERLFFTVTYVLLFGTGSKLILDALT